MSDRGDNDLKEPLSPRKPEAVPASSPYYDNSLQPDSRQSSIRVFDHLEGFTDAEDDTTLKSKISKWAKQSYLDEKVKAKQRGVWDWLAVFLPCIGWLSKYSVKDNLLMDLTAGISIGFMVVPQGMSYALLAGLPAVYGLYGAFIPVLVYSVFGSSPHLAVGPVAVTSLLLGHALHTMFPEADNIDDPNNPGDLAGVQSDYNAAAIQVTVLVGLLYIGIGILRLGFFANFLSHSVISGFTTGAALIIGLSQLKYLLGVTIPSKHTALETFIELVKALPDSQWRECVMGFTWLIALVALKHVSKSYPKLSWLRPLGPISVCVIAILAVVIGDLDSEGNEKIRTVKHVPQGLPSITVDDWFPMTQFSKQLGTAFILFIVGFMESISISKALARKGKYEISVQQEIMAMGIANVFGAMFSSYATTGSFSRSAVSADIGAKRQLQGTITGVCVMLVLLFITPVFERVPYNAMGAIVLSSVIGLLELSEARFLFKANFLDFLVWMAAFLGTVFLGVEIGLGIAIGLAVVLVVYQSAFPHTAVLGVLPETDVYRNKKQYPSAKQHPHLCIVRIDAPIYFANVEWIRGRVDKYRMRAERDPALSPVYFVILDMSPVPFVDSTGMHALHELVSQLHSDGQQLVLANPSRKVQAQLKRVDLLNEVGSQWVFVRTADAVKVCQQAVREKLAESKAVAEQVEVAVGVRASTSSEER